MFLNAHGLYMWMNTHRTCTLTALPTGPSSVTLVSWQSGSLDFVCLITWRVALISQPNSSYMLDVLDTLPGFLQFLSERITSRYYVEGRKCCWRNRSIVVALYSVIAGRCMQFTPHNTLASNSIAVLSYWPNYWLFYAAGVEEASWYALRMPHETFTVLLKNVDC